MSCARRSRRPTPTSRRIPRRTSSSRPDAAGPRISATRASSRACRSARWRASPESRTPHVLGRVEPGQVVLDLGCGAGTDLLIAAQMVGPGGRAIGIDMTPTMLDRARESAAEMGLENVELHQGLIESLPLPDESVDVVISNGVIDLVPDKDAVFAEIDRVLRPGGRLQLADVIIHTEVSEDARKRIDLWTG